MNFPVFEPYIGNDELDACKAALDCKYLGMGSFVGRFEAALADFLRLGTERHIVAVSTGHAALHLAFMALEINDSHEVITPSFNNIADIQAISAVGARPVFCDVRTDDLCIDPAKVEELINERTRAIIAIDYGACIADHQALAQISKRYGVPIVHDAAHSFGSLYKSQPIGHQGFFTMLSFDPIKNITCIDGGALIFEDKSYVEMLREMRLIGMSQRIEDSYCDKRDWSYDVHRLGFRYHMPNLHAAIGLSQLARFEEISMRRITLYETYYARLSGESRLTLQTLRADVVPFIFCLRVPADLRKSFKDFLKQHGIETGIHWTPCHNFSKFAKCKSGDLSSTNKIAKEIVSLPFYPGLELDDVHYICDKIISFLHSN
jgi:dTDP-4-amino-4,6-dideoxygalactose transaminase